MNIERKTQMAGFYTIKRINGDTGEVVDTLEFPNVITNIGLDRLGIINPVVGVMVGTGNQAPSITDTILQAQVAYTSSRYGNSVYVPGAGTGPNYFSSRSDTFRFAQGAAAGNLSEIGAGWNTGSSWLCFSRALIRDSEGNPTTITVLPNEILDVTYTIRVYVPTDEVVVEGVVLLGNTYTVRIKAAQAETNYASMVFQGGAADLLTSGVFYAGDWSPSLEGSPSSAGGSVSASIIDPINQYAPGSYKLSRAMGLNLASGNFPTGVRSFRTSTQHSPAFQMQFEPPIMKTAAMQFKMTIEVSWGRYDGPT